MSTLTKLVFVGDGGFALYRAANRLQTVGCPS